MKEIRKKQSPSARIIVRTRHKVAAYKREIVNMEIRIKQLQEMVEKKKNQIVEMEY